LASSFFRSSSARLLASSFLLAQFEGGCRSHKTQGRRRRPSVAPALRQGIEAVRCPGLDGDSISMGGSQSNASFRNPVLRSRCSPPRSCQGAVPDACAAHSWAAARHRAPSGTSPSPGAMFGLHTKIATHAEECRAPMKRDQALLSEIPTVAHSTLAVWPPLHRKVTKPGDGPDDVALVLLWELRSVVSGFLGSCLNWEMCDSMLRLREF